MGRDHRAVRRLVKFHAKLVQPENGVRSLGDELDEQLGLRGEVSAAERVEIVDRRAVVRLVRRLNAALRHHGVGVADAQLGDDEHALAVLLRFERRRDPRAAAPDDEDVAVVIDPGEVDVRRRDPRTALEDRRELVRNGIAPVRADFQRFKFFFFIVRVVRDEEGVLFLRRHSLRLEKEIGLARRLHLFYGLKHIKLCHTALPSHASISRLL